MLVSSSSGRQPKLLSGVSDAEDAGRKSVMIIVKKRMRDSGASNINTPINNEQRANILGIIYFSSPASKRKEGNLEKKTTVISIALTLRAQKRLK